MNWIKNWFSNMLPMDVPLIHEGISYKTVENFYQAMKLDSIQLRNQIANLNPYAAKKAIRNRSIYKWSDNWNKEKSLEIMEFALRHKFAPETSWANKLIATGDEEIVEWNNWNDIFWGKSITTKKGENHLGIILMKIRTELKSL